MRKMYHVPKAKFLLHHWKQLEENFDRIHIDYVGPRNGYYFLIIVDAKSKPKIRILSKAPTTESTIRVIRRHLCYARLPTESSF